MSWINAPFWDANPPGYQGSNTFQVILIEQNRNIIFQYQQQTGVSSAVTNFITVGMENSTGTIGLNPYFDTYPPANYTMEFYSQPINRIKGYCFIDNNLNGIKDGNESGINQLMVNSTGGYTYTSQPDVNGYFSNPADTGSTTTIIQNLLYYTVTPASHISTFATYYNTDTINFAMVPVPGIQDVSVSIIPLTPARPGFNVTYQISYTNLGTVTMSDSLYFISDTLLNYVSSTQPVINFNGDTMTFSYQNLAPLQTQTIEVTFSIPVPPTVQIGTIFTLSAYIKPYATDMNAENNSMQIHQTVTGSYDPNDKTMLGGSFITPTQVADGDYMHYLIRFQNSGNDTAFTVIVRDTLSSNLQWSTFEMVNASHPYTLTIQDNNILKWDFDHINLPDSNVNEPASHGYIVYKIKPLSSLALGASILNTANIYFDFNLPIKTNTESTIVSPVGIKENPGSLSGIKIFPNPNNGEFIIDLGAQYEKLEIKISNTLWQVLDQQTLTNQRFVNASISEKSGMYFIQINTDKGSKVLKIIKQ